MDLMHEQVCHRQFGIGMITSQTVTTVTVKFCKEYGIKKFIYPSAFESFLELYNPVMKKKMEDEFRQTRKQADEERQQSTENDKKRNEEEQRTLLEQKRNAAKKRASAKKALKKPREKPRDPESAEKGTDV